jgi:membrane-associated PAP2 superfamily phosphatase
MIRPTPRADERGFDCSMPLRWFFVPAVIGAVTIVIGETIDADRAIVRLLYDPVTAAFPLNANFWLAVVMHHLSKYIVVAIGCAVAVAYALSYLRPALRPERRMLLFLVLALALAPSSVTLGKAVSDRDCPWDVKEFGGTVPYATLLRSRAHDAPPGHCFPAGHASTGFALLGFYFAAHARRRRRAARWALALGLGAGVALGLGRVAQGAHFPSHVVGAGLFCWMVMVALYFAVMRTP